MLTKFAILAGFVGATWMLLSILGRSHWNASTSCSRVIGADGVERDSWSFSARYANTLLGKTIGRFKVARARSKFSRQERTREAAAAAAEAIATGVIDKAKR